MIDGVGAEAGANQPLEQITLLVPAFGCPKPAERAGSIVFLDREKPRAARSSASDHVASRNRLLGSAGFGIGRILAPHQRYGEPIWMESVVPAEATFHTETAAVEMAIDSLCPAMRPSVRW